MIKYTGDIRCDFDKATAEISKLKDRILGYQEQISSLCNEANRLRRAKDSQKKQYEETIAEKDAIIKELQNRLAHAEAINNHDGTNTGTPTGQTPPGKNKVIPNTRRGSGKSKGGQPGHEKHSLNTPDESEVTDTIRHEDDVEGFSCPNCSGTNYIPTGESEIKYEFDVRVKVVKIKHEFFYYKCQDCGTVFRSVIPPQLKENAQYGSSLQALALSLVNTVNAPMNKTSMFLSGIADGELSPCDGYIAKLQSRAAKALLLFRDDLRLLLITRPIVYWDDSVIMINTNRACFRFYEDEAIAYYTAHEHKDMQSIDDDRVLAFLTSDTKTMHDHNRVNYNEKFSFDNLECNQHLQRDCQKNSDDTCHTWSSDLKDQISSAIKDRNDLIARDVLSFTDDYVEDFHHKLDIVLAKGWRENACDPGNYGTSFERTLLARISEYRRNYFRWLEDFSLPTTNNLSERGLRGIKSHMKISGQFESVAAADNHAIIRTYIETCRRHGINEIHALQRLSAGNPYTVAEILKNEVANPKLHPHPIRSRCLNVSDMPVRRKG